MNKIDTLLHLHIFFPFGNFSVTFLDFTIISLTSHQNRVFVVVETFKEFKRNCGKITNNCRRSELFFAKNGRKKRGKWPLKKTPSHSNRNFSNSSRRHAARREGCLLHAPKPRCTGCELNVGRISSDPRCLLGAALCEPSLALRREPRNAFGLVDLLRN